jgi:hypothetical protein
MQGVVAMHRNICGLHYKHITIVNDDSSIIVNDKCHLMMTLELSIMMVRDL